MFDHAVGIFVAGHPLGRPLSRGSGPVGYPAEPLVSYRTNRLVRWRSSSTDNYGALRARGHLRTCRRIGSGLKQTQAQAAARSLSVELQVIEAATPGQSLSALRCHLVLDQANDGRDDRAGDATPDRLAGESADVDSPAPAIIGISALTSWPPPTPPTAPAIVLPSAPKLMSFDAAPTALPPTTPAISWMIDL